MKSLCLLSAIVLLSVLFLSTVSLSVNRVAAQTSQAQSKLQAADSAVNQAFNAVLNAEKAGANVTGLDNQLSVAANWLAEAQVAYRAGDFNSTVVKADIAASAAQDVKVLAQSAESAALVNAQNGFWFAIGFSVGGSVVFVLGLFFVWGWLKKNYVKGMLDAKPEVTQCEA